MPPDLNKTIQGLWIGPELSVMEQLSISSFLRNGHDYHLYVYDEVKNVPVGTVVMDASEILPSSRIFQYKRSPSYAGFANFFRYKLLLERGGWWADTDTVCLKPFDFPEQYVFSSQMSSSRLRHWLLVGQSFLNEHPPLPFERSSAFHARRWGFEVVNSGVIKAPAGSSVMAYAWEVCQTKNPARLVWGETGPKLMAKAVKKFSLQRYQKTHHVFCPVNYEGWRTVLQPGFEKIFGDETYTIHLWNEMWRAAGQDKNAQYHATCLYERLKRSYLPVATQSQCSRGLSSDIISSVGEA